MICQSTCDSAGGLPQRRGLLQPAVVLSLELAILAFIVDLDTPYGVADGFLYVLAVLTCFWLPNANAALYAAAALMLPMAIGTAMSPPGAPMGVEIINRLLGAVTIWLTAILIWHNARLVAERKQLLADLARQDRNKEHFLATLGHELRNPVAAIHSSLELITAGDQATRRALTILRRQSHHLAFLIDDLLDIARIKHGKLQLRRKIIDLNRCAFDTTEAMRRQIEAKGLVLELNPAAQPIYVDADAERLAQILDNLLRNALVYTRQGRITVTVGATREEAWIAIGDTGEGIEPDEAATLFEPFRQAARVTSVGGLGLGLTLVRQLVEMHGGAVALHSAGHGAGSEFVITVPQARSTPARGVVSAVHGARIISD